MFKPIKILITGGSKAVQICFDRIKSGSNKIRFINYSTVLFLLIYQRFCAALRRSSQFAEN
jgi:hypothetical protein